MEQTLNTAYTDLLVRVCLFGLWFI